MGGRELYNIYYKKPGKCTWKIRSRSGKSQGKVREKLCSKSVGTLFNSSYSECLTVMFLLVPSQKVILLHNIKLGETAKCFFFLQVWFSFDITGLPLRSCWTIGLPCVGGPPNVRFLFLVAAGFEPTSCTLPCGMLPLRHFDPKMPDHWLQNSAYM